MQSLPIFNCRVDFLELSISASISSFVSGSPRISSLDLTCFGPEPGRNGPGACTGFTPFLCGGGSLNESNSGSFFLLDGSGLLPVHGLAIVSGPNGDTSGSRSFTGLAFGVSV